MNTDKNGRRIGKRAYPLRKIVVENVPGEIKGFKSDRFNLLECGHYAFRSTDMYGETCPVKQRCGQCYELNNEIV